RALALLRTTMGGDLLDQLFRHVLGLPIAFFEKHPPAEVIQRFYALRLLRDVLGGDALGALLDVPMLLVSFVVMATIDGPLFAVVAGFGAGFAGVALGVAPRLAALEAEHQATAAAAEGRLIEVFGGVTTLRAAGDEDAGVGHFSPRFLAGVELGARQDSLD